MDNDIQKMVDNQEIGQLASDLMACRHASVEPFLRATQKAVADEREACAKVAESINEDAGAAIAAGIRARS